MDEEEIRCAVIKNDWRGMLPNESLERIGHKSGIRPNSILGHLETVFPDNLSINSQE